MAIRFTPQYNARIRRIVNNYNQKVKRANKLGKIRKSDLPEMASVKAMKKSYTNRVDLDRELRTLELFNRKDVRNKSEGVSQYDIDVINLNKDAAIQYYQRMADILATKAVTGYPLSRGKYNEFMDNINLLQQDTSGVFDTRQLKSMSAAIQDYRRSFERQATGYRGFMSQLDMVMDYVGIDSAKKKEFFDKFSKLNAVEFTDLYESNDLISKIYELADSPKYTGGEVKLLDSKENAEELINTLMEEADYLIEKTKRKYNL